MLKKIGRALKAIAPVAASVAATATLGPQVGAQIRNVLGLSPEASDDDVEAAAIAADPTQLSKLRQIDADLKRDLRGMDLKELEIAVESKKVDQEDRASARAREIAVKDNTPRIDRLAFVGRLPWADLPSVLPVTARGERGSLVHLARHPRVDGHRSQRVLLRVVSEQRGEERHDPRCPDSLQGKEGRRP